ncbi:MAG: cytidine deaminase [Bacteroidetes bacterium]|nr:cytidine deaminase [Bacteroidota bacterium]
MDLTPTNTQVPRNAEYRLTYRIGAVEDFGDPVVAMYRKAQEVWGSAYAPYSGFYVAAVVLTRDGSMLAGTNQENASYPVGICAERVVLSALSCREGGGDVAAMLVLAGRKGEDPRRGEGVSDQPVAPCGMCRQALIEQIKRQKCDFPVFLAGMKGSCWHFEAASALLPFAFFEF